MYLITTCSDHSSGASHLGPINNKTHCNLRPVQPLRDSVTTIFYFVPLDLPNLLSPITFRDVRFRLIQSHISFPVIPISSTFLLISNTRDVHRATYFLDHGDQI